MTILDALAKAGIAFVALKENIRVEGKRDIQTKVMTTLFALSARIWSVPYSANWASQRPFSSWARKRIVAAVRCSV